MGKQMRNQRDVYQGDASDVFPEKTKASVFRYKWPRMASEVLQLCSFWLLLAQSKHFYPLIKYFAIEEKK